MRKIIMVVSLLAALGLAACAAPAGPAATPSPGTVVPAGPEATPSPYPVVPKPTAVTAPKLQVTLKRSGGIAGLSDLFVIGEDGSVTVNSVAKQVEPGAGARLVDQIRLTGIFDVSPGKYLPANPCCDRFTYDLTLVVDGRALNFTTMDASETAPRALLDTLTLVQQYIAAAR